MGHLDSAFLLADGIAHGINLRWTPVLQSAGLELGGDLGCEVRTGIV